MGVIRTFAILIISGFFSGLSGQVLPVFEHLKESLSPLALGQFIADKIVDQTTFHYEYTVKNPYSDIESVDFRRSLAPRGPGIAYALSQITSEAEQVETFEVGRTGGLKIWINDQLVFSRDDVIDCPVIFEEKTYVLPEKFTARLNKGENKILVKSGYSGNDKWLFLLQSRNMGPYAEKGKKIKASVSVYIPGMTMVNWLILGCFDNPGGTGMSIPYEPEQKIELYKLYHSESGRFTWDIPRIHILAENPGGGKFYAWSYHVGGFVWGLQRLTQETGSQKYADYANRWCDYSLRTMALAEFQTKELHAVRSMNWGTAGRPMLDYTSAPSIPFITRLVYEKDFPGRAEYVAYAEKIMYYLIKDQFRLPDGTFARKYTPSPSVWADDMFMGIPYLLYSARYTTDPLLKQRLYDDAANQILLFNKYLFKNGKRLYMQACFADRPDEKIPFWSRGNGWAVWGTSEVLQNLPKNHKLYKTILGIYREHIKGIVATQDEDGYWHNILDMPETVRESSGTAIFTLCIARGINNGWLSRKDYGPAVESAWKALKTFVGSDGNLYGVKGGTNFSPDPEDYARTPFVKSDTHGILPLLFCCFEMEHYLSKVQ